MKKSFLLAACLVLPLASFAADHKAAARKTAAAAAPAASAVNPREALMASKHRGSAMGACQQQATDKSLVGVERKTFLSACIKG